MRVLPLLLLVGCAGLEPAPAHTPTERHSGACLEDTYEDEKLVHRVEVRWQGARPAERVVRVPGQVVERRVYRYADGRRVGETIERPGRELEQVEIVHDNGRLARVVRRAGESVREQLYRYEERDGRLVSRTVMSGADETTTRYAYDERGRVVGETTGDITTELRYADGRVVERLTTSSGRVTRSTQRWADGRLVERVRLEGDRELVRWTHRYDAHGNRLETVERRGDVVRTTRLDYACWATRG